MKYLLSIFCLFALSLSAATIPSSRPLTIGTNGALLGTSGTNMADYYGLVPGGGGGSATNAIAITGGFGTNTFINGLVVTGAVTRLAVSEIWTSHTLGYGTADLSEGSVNYGPDYTTQLQLMADQATNGPLTIHWDGMYSSYGINWWSGTEIIASQGAGMILRSNANNHLFRNALRGGTNFSNIQFRDFTVRGGIWNGGGYDTNGVALYEKNSLSNGWHSVFSFLGAEDITFDSVTIRGPRAFGRHLGNSRRILITGKGVDVGTNAAVFNRDGDHFNGPIRYLTINDIWYNTYDDAINLEANGGGTNCASCPNGIGIVGYNGWTDGDISDVTIDNVTFADSAYGIRMLSHSNVIERVSVSNIKGKTQFNAFLIGVYAEHPEDISAPYLGGRYKDIVFDGIDVQVDGGNYYPETFWISAPGSPGQPGFENITFRNIIDRNVSFPLMYFSQTNTMRNVIIDGITSYRTNADRKDVIIFGGAVENLTMVNNIFDRRPNGTDVGTNFYPINFGVAVHNLTLANNTANGYADLFYYPYLPSQVLGFVTNMTSSGTTVTPGWTLDFNTAQYGAASPKALHFAASAGFVLAAAKSHIDLGPFVSISSDLMLTGSVGVASTMGLFTAGENPSPWYLTTIRKDYALTATMVESGSGSISIGYQRASGTSDVVPVTLNSSNIVADVPYRFFMELRPSGTSAEVVGKIQRISDGKWLTSGDQWGGSETVLMSWVDTNTTPILPVFPKSGVVFYTSAATNGNLLSSNFTVRAASPTPVISTLGSDRVNIGTAAAGASLHSGDEGVIIKPSVGRGLLEVHSATGDTEVWFESVDGFGVNLATGDTNTPLRFYLGTTNLGLTVRYDPDARAIAEAERMHVTDYLRIDDRTATSPEQDWWQLSSGSGLFDFRSSWGATNIAARLTSNGVLTVLSDITAGGQFIGNGSGLTNLVITTAATNAPVPSVTYNADGTPNVWVPLSATNSNHLLVSNNLATQIHVIAATSDATNYLLNAEFNAQHVAVTGNVRFIGLSNGQAGYQNPVSICLSNTTGNAYTVEFTNTFKLLRGSTNTIPANGVSWIEGYVRGDRVTVGAVPEQ